jgi:hypothetical protein
VVSLFIHDNRHPGVINEDCVTAEAASELTGYNIQHIHCLCYVGKLDALRVGRSWLIKVQSLEAYLNEVVPAGDGRFGPRVPSKQKTNDNASYST